MGETPEVQTGKEGYALRSDRPMIKGGGEKKNDEAEEGNCHQRDFY